MSLSPSFGATVSRTCWYSGPFRPAPSSLLLSLIYLSDDQRPSTLFSLFDVRTVYETVVAHEELVSHETAMRVARGGGIGKENLEVINHL